MHPWNLIQLELLDPTTPTAAAAAWVAGTRTMWAVAAEANPMVSFVQNQNEAVRSDSWGDRRIYLPQEEC